MRWRGETAFDESESEFESEPDDEDVGAAALLCWRKKNIFQAGFDIKEKEQESCGYEEACPRTRRGAHALCVELHRIMYSQVLAERSSCS